MNGFSTTLKNQPVDIDAGIKALLAILLAVTACFCHNGWEFLFFSAYLAAVTFLLKSNLRFILKNLLSYGVIFVVPFLLGFLLHWLMGIIVPGNAYSNGLALEGTAFKMIRIFFIWYIGSLYFSTTPFLAIAEMLNKVLAPLNAWGIPVTRHLHMVICAVGQLARSADQFKQDIMDKSSRIFKGNHSGIKAKLSEFAGILADFIVNSLQQTDQVQGTFANINLSDGTYKLDIVRNDIIAISSLIVFLLFFFTCL
ncbi:MAG: CbiQ family ECF transporter T component [Syntrophomonadaceae bacterium]|nr:CbiQ family ECF transporter T component [Syntrophomonadaceae bacterium]